MSTDYHLLKPVSVRDLFDGRLEEFGVREFVPAAHEGTRTLTDGNNYLHVYTDDADLLVACISRYGANAPSKILNAIADAFDVRIVSEYEPQFWGFDTQEEWDADQEEWERVTGARFLIEVVKYCKGEPNDIGAGTSGHIKAKIAKGLTEKDPALLLPENQDKLRNEFESIYDREHVVRITLSPQQIAYARMLSTHEEDLLPNGWVQ